MNCKNVSLEASIRTAKCLLWWRECKLQNIFSGGGKVNCKKFSLVANMLTAKCLLGWRIGELQNICSGGE